MSDSDQRQDSSETVRARAHEVRYSLVEMMEEVREERIKSALGRELLDATEIEKMFAKRIRKIKR